MSRLPSHDRPLFRFRALSPVAFVLVLLLSAFLGACAGGDSDSTPSDEEHLDAMTEEHAQDDPEPSPAASLEPASPVVTERVVYGTVGDAEVTGYLAKPETGAEGAPGILVIQEWWGLNENIEAMARRLAGEGYVALAVDLYGEVAEEPDRARELMQAAMAASEDLEANLRAGYAYLESLGAPKIGSIGWCFGGGMSLRTALLHPEDLDGAVIYYGRLVTETTELEPLQMPVLGIFGSEDQGIPLDMVAAFEGGMKELGKDVRIEIYEGADHAFANPSGNRYDAEAAEDAWAKTVAFFAETLR
ncbi:MAG: dienelactone hydrolase family protein [Acidobacteriota bacterium]